MGISAFDAASADTDDPHIKPYYAQYFTSNDMHWWPFIHQADTLKRITRSWCTFQNPAAGFTCLSNCHYQNQYRSERATERTQPPPHPLHPLQPSSHLLSNVLVFISRLNKCLFLQHARTHTNTHTRWFLSPNELVQNLQHFLPKAAPSILVARVIEVSVLVQQPNTLQTQDTGTNFDVILTVLRR